MAALEIEGGKIDAVILRFQAAVELKVHSGKRLSVSAMEKSAGEESAMEDEAEAVEKIVAEAVAEIVAEAESAAMMVKLFVDSQKSAWLAGHSSP